AILSLARRLAVDYGEQVLVFVPTRYDSRNWAHHLASRLSLPPSEALLEELSLYEDTHARELLREVAASGVAFHNADLSWDLRALIEHHFNAGSLRVLISTSTLGQGVNLTGRNVLHVQAMVTTDPWTGRQTKTALSRSRFHNQGGRGARFSREVDFGRSMLVARNEAECERMMRDYVRGEIEPLTPRIDTGSLDLYTLDLVASRVACTKEALTAFFHNTFSGRVLWQADAAPVARRIDETVETLVQRDLLRAREDGRLEATGLGEVAAGTGLQSATIEAIAAWLREGPRVLQDDPVEALVVLAATADARQFPLSAPTGSSVAEAFVEPLRERLLRRAEGAAPSVERILSPAGGFTREALAGLKKALVLDAWIGPQDTREIEERFQAFSGALANLASHFAWLAQGAAALARSLALPSDLCRALECLAERLVLGCGAAGMDFRNLRVQGLSRAYIRALAREGYSSVAALAAADLTDLSRLAPPRIAEEAQAEARRLVGCPEGPDGETADDSAAPWGKASAVAPDEELGPKPHERERAKRQEEKREGPVRSREETASEASRADLEGAGKTQAPDESDVLLEVDLRGAGRVVFQGKELRLPNLAFRLLTVLARSPQIGVSYDEILRSVWPDAHVEPQQIFAHRRRLLGRLAEVVPLERARALIQVERSRGLRLTLPAEQVRVIER
ncbi:MAG TPA: hypothetical protein VM492_16405, partial [Sumerlaeia bacterium]|nr:hypothetical protein [Sumerlaeia bacterium]